MWSGYVKFRVVMEGGLVMLEMGRRWTYRQTLVSQKPCFPVANFKQDRPNGVD